MVQKMENEGDLQKIIKVQALARGWLARRRYRQSKELVIKTQAVVRAWLVGKKMLNLVRMNAKRARVMIELTTIENNYVGDLRLLINDFKVPLVQDHIITQSEAEKIFGNIGTILNVHSALLEELLQKRNNLDCKTELAPIFSSVVPKLEVYKKYIAHYEEASEFLNSLRTGNPVVQKYIKSKEGSQRMRNMDLHDLLVEPVQRIPRYVLLLKEYLKNCPTNSKDTTLLPKVVQSLVSLLQEINSAKRKVLNESKSKLLLEEVDGVHIEGLTNYEMEGELIRTRSHRSPTTVYMFLFGEMLVMAKYTEPDVYAKLSKLLVHKKAYKFKMQQEINIRNVADVKRDEKDPTGKSFTLKVSRKSMPEKHNLSSKDEYKIYHFQVKSEKQQMSWTNKIKKVIENRYSKPKSSTCLSPTL